MDLAKAALELGGGDHSMSHQQQQSVVSPVSPLRPAPVPSGQVMGSNYYSTPPTLLHHHHGGQQQQQQVEGTHSVTKLKLAHAASGNGLSARGTEHKSSDQVVADQAREILRQAVVSATSGYTENAAKGGAAAAASNVRSKGAVRYRECQKNHAAGIGGHAIDGCGEFMPDADDPDALRCAACDCHRNFHRREVDGEPACDCKLRRPRPGSALPPPPLALPPLAMAAATSAPTDSDDPDDHIVTSGAMHLSLRSPSAVKKRFRTKFSPDQKDQMCAFADKLGWRIQKHDEAAVQDFCAAVGVKRHVLKVWMHNNKHTMGKKP